jgi:hypothetical protein
VLNLSGATELYGQRTKARDKSAVVPIFYILNIAGDLFFVLHKFAHNGVAKEKKRE